MLEGVTLHPLSSQVVYFSAPLSTHHADHPVLPWSSCPEPRKASSFTSHAQLPLEAVGLRGERLPGLLLAFLEGLL